ncbi:MAG: glucose-6-phosphate dehydrogenase [Armatimonadetes bacterium]|nr:glucose-6-phosphate dehydrogenase [Armatimonadota bacterium]
MNVTKDHLSSNPFREGLRLEKTPEPCAVVIFGATGDLTARKLMPALYNLFLERLLPTGFSVVAFARREKTVEQFRTEMREAVSAHSRTQPLQAGVWRAFAEGIFYHRSDFRETEGFVGLGQLLNRIDRERGTCGNRIYYLATPPDCYDDIITQLGLAGLVESPPRVQGQVPDSGPGGDDQTGWSRIIVEKPFGHDLATAHGLNEMLLSVFRENQVYRIDHYLGKETVQNILIFRFGNGIFEPVWNRRYVDHVQITAAENLGVEGRAGYFEPTGTLRDMVQNHLLQLLALVAMEPPASMEASAVRDERLKVFRSLHLPEPEEIAQCSVRGRYSEGSLAGLHVPGYREEPGVAPDSTTETFVAMRLRIDNWRWADVPFFLRSGKRLPKRVTEISIQFKRPPLLLFGEAGRTVEPNILTLRIQPDEGISLKFGAKLPGQSMRLRSVNMDFHYSTSFGVQPPEAYERLLLDCMLGDSTLFTRRDEVEAEWQFVDSVRLGWQDTSTVPLCEYQAGTWGPDESHALIARDARRWRRL